MGRWWIVQVGGGWGGGGSECVRVVRMTNSRNCEYVLEFLDTASLRYVCSSLYTARIGYEHMCYADKYPNPSTKETYTFAHLRRLRIHYRRYSITMPSSSLP